jgi:hypothetical protein
LKYQKRSATVAEATAEQKKGPADIMSAEVRNCWQKPEWQREPAKYTWSNTRKTRNSKREQKADGTEEDDFFGQPHGTTLPDIYDANREGKSQMTLTGVCAQNPQ